MHTQICVCVCVFFFFFRFFSFMCWCDVWSLSCVRLFCDPMDCSLPGSSVHGILQARILEWVAIPFSRGSSRPKDQTQVSCIAGRFFTIRATRETQINYNSFLKRKKKSIRKNIRLVKTYLVGYCED